MGMTTSAVASEAEVVLHVGPVCIETAARRAWTELVQALVAGERDADAASRMLRDFLASTDFAKLRARHPELAGGRSRTVRLRRDENGGIVWELVAEEGQAGPQRESS
jgi:hypothetical protein